MLLNSLKFGVSSLKLLPRIFIFLLPVLSSLPAFSQELKCNVTITAVKLQATEPKIFKTLETSVFEFLNDRKWTNDTYRAEEKIECSMFINVTEELGANIFRAQITIQSSRPVFNSDYSTVLLNHADNEWVFEYTEFEPLNFNENDFISNLTSVLAYYAYVIIGLDYDTYSLNGGTQYFQKAQAIVNSIPTNINSELAKGWKPFEGDKNRYWLVDNLLSARFTPVRESLYLYHRQGLDVMYEDMNTGRQAVLNCLRKIGEVAEEYPTAVLIKVFFTAKSQELVKIFKGAPPNEKANAVQLLYKADPSNSANYAKIMKG